jgi:hypothetical protein
MMRMAGAIVFTVTVFVSVYVPLESFAMLRRMKTRARRRGNSLRNPLINRYPSRPSVPPNLRVISLEPKVSSFAGATVRPIA